MSTKAKVITVLVGVVLVGVSLANAGAWPGRVNGHHDRVLAHSTDSYRITFEGGEPAVVAVSGDGDTDLDLEVRDENGHVVGRDFDDTDDCIVRWTPRWTGKFTIRIINRGSVYNDYVLWTN